MVYCGKPSKGCPSCRYRRLKCDTIQPFCSQCIRANRICGGYRDEVDMLFRHETTDVVHKAQRRRADPHIHKNLCLEKSGLEHYKWTSSREITLSVCEELPMSNNVLSTLCTSLENQAEAYFFANYVPNAWKSSRASYNFEDLPFLYAQGLKDCVLSQIVAALGVAGIAKVHAPSLMPSARQMYIRALHLLQTALQDTFEAKADHTLLSVMLLCLYEINTGSTTEHLQAWLKHVAGAIALLKFRGEAQLHTGIGRRMFRHLRPQITLHCFHTLEPTPDFVNTYAKICRESYPIEEDASATLSAIANKCCTLRAEAAAAGSNNISNELEARARTLDAELELWYNESHGDASFYIESNELAGRRNIHIYRSSSYATTLNNYRTMRIMLHDFIIMLKRPQSLHVAIPRTYDSTNYSTQIQESKDIIIRSIQDICDSVYYLLDCPRVGTMTTTTRIASATCVIWPLYVSAQVTFLPQNTRIWIVEKLNYIGTVIGVSQATMLASSCGS